MIRGVFFIIVPLLALLLSAPILTDVIPHEARTGAYHWQFLLIGLAAGGGLLAAPGYLLLVFRPVPATRSVWKRCWLRASLALGVLSCLVGAGFAILAFWPVAILPLAAAGMCIRLLLLLEQAEVRKRVRPAPSL